MKSLFLSLCVSLLTGCAMLHLSPSKKIYPLRFEERASDPAYRFVFGEAATDTNLIRLRSRWPVAELVKNAQNEQEKVLLLLNWVRKRWEHNGWNDAKTNNACLILERAEKGEKFRCVEYGIVLKNVLMATGLKARTLGLMTRDVAKTKAGAGHVLTEVWLRDRQKWALVDAQFDAMPVLDGIPLNAVELQAALIARKPVQFVNHLGPLNKSQTAAYLDFIPHYLYYFTAAFDQRTVPAKERVKVQDKTGLVLVPIGADEPRVFQRKYPMNSDLYTRSVADFYPRPE